MPVCDKPRLPIPDSLRAQETGTFAESTVVIRLPNIARRALEANDFPPDVRAAIQDLIDDIPNALIRPLVDDPLGPEDDRWPQYIEDVSGQNWLQAPWFFIEEYFYRRLLEATGYFRSGPLQGFDPYGYEKQRGLDAFIGPIRGLARRLDHWLEPDQDTFAALLAIDLWGNQADLSLWPADGDDSPDHSDRERQLAHTLADDTEAVIAHLNSLGEPAHVDFMLDNAGFELITDLCLADYLLTTGMASTVHLHGKTYPVFVSDVMIPDFHHTIDYLIADEDQHVQALGARLKTHVDQRRLLITTHHFWTSPLPAWEMPDDLRSDLAQSDLVISKGDANYRRLLGDRHWDLTTPFDDVLCYFPAPLVALRTCKSEVAVGLRPGQPESITAQDEKWLVNGMWGMIEFYNPTG